jgi:hypothetical protein
MIYNLSKPSEVQRFNADAAEFILFEKKVSLKLHKEVRSLNQNRLYWLWLGCIAHETGNDTETLHEFFKNKYLQMRCKTVKLGAKDELVYMLGSTTELDTAQFKQYLDCIKEFAFFQCDLLLPEPKEQGWDEFYEKYKNFIN